MALTPIKGGFIWPERVWECSNNTARLLDAAGEKFASLVTFTTSTTIGKIRFRLGSVPTGDTLRVSIQDVDTASGDPDGGVDQYRSVSVSGGDANTWKLTGLLTTDGTDSGGKRSVAAGDSVFVVFDFSTYTSGVINLMDSTTGQAVHNANYSDHYTTSWAKLVSWGCFEVLDDADQVVLVIGAIPAINNSSTSINNTTAVREQGNYFQVPAPCKAGGLFVAVDGDGDYEAILYDADGATKLASTNVDKDVRQQTGVANTILRFASDVTLSTGTWYRMVIKPTTSTSLTFRQMDLGTSAGADGMPGGLYCYWTERSSGGSWTEKSDRIAKIWLWVTAIDDGSGGGASGGRVIGG